MVNHKVIGAVFLHQRPAEEERVRGSQDHLFAAKARAGGAVDVVKFAAVGVDVVGGVVGFEMLIVRTAIENDVPGGGDFPGRGVVNHVVGAQDKAAEADVNVAPQVINVARFFLPQRLDGDVFAGLAGAGELGTTGRWSLVPSLRSGQALGRWRLLFLAGDRRLKPGDLLRKRLAGY